MGSRIFRRECDSGSSSLAQRSRLRQLSPGEWRARGPLSGNRSPSNTVVSGRTIDAIGGSSFSGQNATGVYFEGSGTGKQFNGNTVTAISASAGAAGGLVCNGGTTMADNVISGVTNSGSASDADGLNDPTLALDNQIIDCYYGIYNG